ncbi:MAG TPA: hypothetical protein VHF26_01420, partial [Trebonia sp.]|nr:hypothetical protein [Trebonia sp.]
MVPADIHDFFVASAGVAGALIGLLFVAISVATERLARVEAEGQLHRIRARGALLAFVNTLTVSLFAMMPGDNIGMTAILVGIVGLMFVLASLLSLVRLRDVRWATARDALFLVGMVAVFILELTSGIDVYQRPGDAGSVKEIAILVTVCFLIGIYRAWDLIGGPSIGFGHEVAALVRAGLGKDTAAPGGVKDTAAP